MKYVVKQTMMTYSKYEVASHIQVEIYDCNNK